MVHVRYEGRSYDFNEARIGLRAGMGDAEIKRVIARQLDARPEKLNGYVIDRSPSGDVIIRPEAVYG